MDAKTIKISIDFVGSITASIIRRMSPSKRSTVGLTAFFRGSLTPTAGFWSSIPQLLP
jgi:hypothetical protein